MSTDMGGAAQSETRKLAAIMFTDMVGFSRQMGSDEVHTLLLLEVHNQIIQNVVAEHHGIVIKTVGDAFLVDFPSVVHAVQCAQQIQSQFRTHNAEKELVEQIHVRIGIHLGDIVQKDGDIFGDGVNIAKRLQELTAPDTICISDVVYRDVVKKLNLGTVVSSGRPKLKNITERFAIYALLPESPKSFWQTLRTQRLKLSRRMGNAHRVAFVGAALLVGMIVTMRYFAPFLLETWNSELGTPAALPLPAKPSIVVLPFVNMSNDPEQEYFSDGITEDITSDLSRISNLFVIARNSAFTYKGKAVKVQDVSREMGVQYVLEGSVRKADHQVRVTAQLIDGITGGHLWSERYDRPLQEIFTVQDEIVQQIVANLRVEVLEAEMERVRHLPTDNLTAYDIGLRGLEHLRRGTKEENAQARQMFERALELDPQYAEAYAAVGWTYFTEWFMGWGQGPQILEQASILAQKARTLDDSLPLPHALLGQVYSWRKQYEEAIAETERAIALDPNNSFAYIRLGSILYFAGRPTEGIEVIEKAMRLNPRYPATDLLNLGLAYRLAGRYEEALATFKQGTARSSWPFFHLVLAELYSQLGRQEEARAEGAEYMKRNPDFSLEVFRQRSPHKDQTVLEQMVDNLRKAGLK